MSSLISVDSAFLALFLLGSCVGSFLNVIILRYIAAFSVGGPARSSSLSLGVEGRSFSVGGRSHCPHCQQTLRWWELLPIVSFIFLRGRCRSCREEISVQYPIVELTMGLLTMVLATPLPTTLLELVLVLVSICIAALLVILFVVDLKTMFLPDHFVGLLLLVVLVKLVLDIRYSTFSIQKSLLGAALGAGFLLFLWLITRGRGIGLGDVKLMVPLGLLFGLPGTLALLFIAYMVGGLVAIYLLLKKEATLKTALPFGPFLCGAALLLLVAPEFPTLLEKLIQYTP